MFEIMHMPSIIEKSFSPFFPKQFLLFLGHLLSAGVKYIVGKGEIAHYGQFFLLPWCFLPCRDFGLFGKGLIKEVQCLKIELMTPLFKRTSTNHLKYSCKNTCKLSPDRIIGYITVYSNLPAEVSFITLDIPIS